MTIKRSKEGNEGDVKNEQPENWWREKVNNLELKCKGIKTQLKKQAENLKVANQEKDLLLIRKYEVVKENEKLKKAQSLFMDWARDQEWELPPHIRDLLPHDPVFMKASAFARVPYGKSPAEYTFNLLYFMALPEDEQVKLGSKVFHREKMIRPEDSAGLQIVIKELHDLLFWFNDDDINMTCEYGFQSTCVPKRSEEPRSEWVVQKNLAINLFDVYTRVVVKKLDRVYTFYSVSAARKDMNKRLCLYAEKVIRKGREKGRTKLCKIEAKFDVKTGEFTLMNDGVNYFEIVNYGMVNYRGHYKLSNLVMDNHPPYKEGMTGMVQIEWTGDCVYDSAED